MEVHKNELKSTEKLICVWVFMGHKGVVGALRGAMVVDDAPDAIAVLATSHHHKSIKAVGHVLCGYRQLWGKWGGGHLWGAVWEWRESMGLYG